MQDQENKPELFYHPQEWDNITEGHAVQTDINGSIKIFNFIDN